MSKECSQNFLSATMQATNTFNQSFLKTMLMGLKLGGVSSKKMSYRERKRTIKLSANIAMAASVSNGMNWSGALITRHAKHRRNKILVRRILGKKRYESITKAYFTLKFQRMISRGKPRMNSSIRRRVHESQGATSKVIAKSLVKKRTKILKRLVPGGEFLNDFSLLGETIDYVISLQAQVNLMTHLAEVVGV